VADQFSVAMHRHNYLEVMRLDRRNCARTRACSGFRSNAVRSGYLDAVGSRKEQLLAVISSRVRMSTERRIHVERTAALSSVLPRIREQLAVVTERREFRCIVIRERLRKHRATRVIERQVKRWLLKRRRRKSLQVSMKWRKFYRVLISRFRTHGNQDYVKVMKECGSEIACIYHDASKLKGQNENKYLNRIQEITDPEERKYLEKAKEVCDQEEIATIPSGVEDLARTVVGLRKAKSKYSRYWQSIKCPDKIREKYLPKGSLRLAPSSYVCRQPIIEEEVKHAWGFGNDDGVGKRRFASLRKLIQNLYIEQSSFEQRMHRLAGKIKGGRLKIGGLKKAGRCVYKWIYKYNLDASRLLDILRASFIFPTLAQVYQAVKQIEVEFGSLLRIKDRFEKPGAGGYRDILINVALNGGFICEIQLHLEGFISIKESMGHENYKFARHFGAKLEAIVERRERTKPKSPGS